MSSGWDVRFYAAADAPRWDDFVRTARNGAFLFERGYMDYHAHRFADASLVVSSGARVVAVLPAHLQTPDARRQLVSHGGLTFGGLVVACALGAADVLTVLTAAKDFLVANGFDRLVYKAMPHILHRTPSEDDLYALHRLGAVLTRTDLCHTIDLARRPPLADGRRDALRKATRAGVVVKGSQDLEGFFALVDEVLASRHATRATHTAAEMQLLAGRFEQIRLTAAFGPGSASMLAGALTYSFEGALHTQYLAASTAGRAVGALDAVVFHLLEAAQPGLRWLSFGASSFDAGRQLNPGLSAHKEMFGAGVTVMQTFELDLGRKESS